MNGQIGRGPSPRVTYANRPARKGRPVEFALPVMPRFVNQRLFFAFIFAYTAVGRP